MKNIIYTQTDISHWADSEKNNPSSILEDYFKIILCSTRMLLHSLFGAIVELHYLI